MMSMHLNLHRMEQQNQKVKHFAVLTFFLWLLFTLASLAQLSNQISGIAYGTNYSGEPVGDGGTRKDGMEQPRYFWRPSIAPSGLMFYTGDMFPPQYRNQVFIAEHGSWNRSKEAGKTGYRVTLVRLEENQSLNYEPFMEGFLSGDEVLGRPVDLLIAPDGAMLVSDDKRGVIYRIGYNED